MVGPVGVLALLIAAASPPEAISADVETLPAGVAYAHDRDDPTRVAMFQDASPFRDEEPQPVPPPDSADQPPMPPDPGYDVQSPAPTVVPPSAITDAGGEPLSEATGREEQTAADYYFGCGDCAEVDGCASKRRSGWLGSLCFDGWIAQGVTLNVDSPRNRSNFPVAFNDRSNEYQLNQLYLALQRPVRGCGHSWDLGGRVDLLYGTDAPFTAARGLETNGDLSPKWNSDRYCVALPQCYMEVHAPWGNGLTMKLGRFYTVLGYESVPAVENFFYSHSYAMQYGEPLTHTGLLGSTRLGSMTIHAGITRGWDNWEDNNNDFSFLGGLSWTSSDGRTVLGYAVDVGREQDEPPSGGSVRTVFSLVLQHQCTDRLQYVVQYDHGFEEQATAAGGEADWYGVNQYLLHTIDRAWKAGLRFEWFRDEDGTRVDLTRGADYFALSAGMNYAPNDWLLVRPEVRWDWVGGSGFRPFADGSRGDQLLLDFDVIVRF